MESHTTASDIWSLGGMIFEMLTGELPFDKPALRQFALDIIIPRELSGEHMKLQLSPNVPAFARELVESCMMYDPVQRPTAAELLQHPFFGQRLEGADPRAIRP